MTDFDLRVFKIDVVKKATRTMLGLRPRQRASGKFLVEDWIGISIDEASRAKPSRYGWVKTRWPLLLGRPMRRYEIEEWLTTRGWPEVRKSACIQCPWRGALEYALWRRDDPDLFESACRWDERLRADGLMRGTKKSQYVLRTLQPLRDLPPIEELEARDDNQFNLFENECEEMCRL